MGNVYCDTKYAIYLLNTSFLKFQWKVNKKIYLKVILCFVRELFLKKIKISALPYYKDLFNNKMHVISRSNLFNSMNYNIWFISSIPWNDISLVHGVSVLIVPVYLYLTDDKTWIIVGCTVGAGVVILTVVIIILIYRCRWD